MPKSGQPTIEGLCIAKRVKDLRAARGWSQDDLAARARLDDKGVVVELESGRFLPPRGPGAPLRQIIEALGLNLAATLRACYGEGLRDNPHWAWCLSDPSLPIDVSLSGFRERLQGLSDAALFQVATPFPTHRMAFLDAVERAYGGYEAFLTNQPPFMFFDDYELVTGAERLARTEADAREYVELMSSYRADRLARLGRRGRRHEVVLARHGLMRFLAAMRDETRARSLADRMISAIADYPATFAIYVLETGAVDLDEIELVAKSPVTLSSDLPGAAAMGEAVCIFHYRLQPGDDRRDYLFTTLTEPSLIRAQVAKMKRVWDGAHYQYIGQNPAVAADLTTPGGRAARDVTEDRIRACLLDAYPSQ